MVTKIVLLLFTNREVFNAKVLTSEYFLIMYDNLSEGMVGQ